jgi:crossover junction endodeoxyribonuclease RusA
MAVCHEKYYSIGTMNVDTIFLTLPYPPSVNTYWGFHGHRRFLTTNAVKFKKEVARQVSLCPTKFTNERLEVVITLNPPDKRVRDIDNIAKPTLDALVSAGLFLDDGQIDRLLIVRSNVVKGGCMTVGVGKL